MPRLLIRQALDKRYPCEGRRSVLRNELALRCNDFLGSGLADPKFESEFCTDDDGKFWSCISEALIYAQLKGKNFPLRSRTGAGPDFLITEAGRKIWIEVTCPQPMGMPFGWTEITEGQAGSVPMDEILLRWTNAIASKANALIGERGYLRSGVVSESDTYVIAVNGCQLRHGPFSCFLGISQFPCAAEAVFPIGPIQVHLDKETFEIVGQGHQVRMEIQKKNGALVPTHAFLNPVYSMISAIWAVDFNGQSSIGNHEPSAVIHNPYAANPLPIGTLPADEEFVARKISDAEFSFERV